MSWELIPDAPEPAGGRGARFGMSGALGAGRPWWILAAVGGVVGLLGLALLIWPFFAASRILAFLVGGAFIANGIAALVGTRIRGIGTAAGVMLILIGVIALAFPAFTVSVLVSFVAVLMLSVGTLWLLIAVRLRSVTGRGAVWIPGLIVALGLAALIWPAFALSIAAVAAGIVTLVIAGSLIGAAFALHRGIRRSA